MGVHLINLKSLNRLLEHQLFQCISSVQISSRLPALWKSRICTHTKISKLFDSLFVYLIPNSWRTGSKAPSPTTLYKVAHISIKTYPQDLLYFSVSFITACHMIYLCAYTSYKIVSFLQCKHFPTLFAALVPAPLIQVYIYIKIQIYKNTDMYIHTPHIYIYIYM